MKSGARLRTALLYSYSTVCWLVRVLCIEILWRETVVAKLELLSQQLLAGPKKTTMNSSQDSGCSDRASSERRWEGSSLEQSISVTTEDVE
jgi:hypothetical protein